MEQYLTHTTSHWLNIINYDSFNHLFLPLLLVSCADNYPFTTLIPRNRFTGAIRCAKHPGDPQHSHFDVETFPVLSALSGQNLPGSCIAQTRCNMLPDYTRCISVTIRPEGVHGTGNLLLRSAFRSNRFKFAEPINNFTCINDRKSRFHVSFHPTAFRGGSNFCKELLEINLQWLGLCTVCSIVELEQLNHNLSSIRHGPSIWSSCIIPAPFS